MDRDKIIRYVYYGVIAVLAFVAMYMIYTGTDEDPKVDFSIWQSAVYAGIATGITVIFAVFGLIFHFKDNLKDVIMAIVLVAAFYIFKGMSSTDVPQKMIDEGITAATLSASEAGVLISIFLIVVAIGVTLASGVRGLFQ